MTYADCNLLEKPRGFQKYRAAKRFSSNLRGKLRGPVFLSGFSKKWGVPNA